MGKVVGGALKLNHNVWKKIFLISDAKVFGVIRVSTGLIGLMEVTLTG